jgi:hypothetical protein
MRRLKGSCRPRLSKTAPYSKGTDIFPVNIGCQCGLALEFNIIHCFVGAHRGDDHFPK